MNTKYLLLALSLSCVVGCGPVYKTFYDMTPPSSPSGRRCLIHCDENKRRCVQEEKYLYQRCEERVARQESDCERNKIYEYRGHHKSPKCVANCYCYTDSCDEPDYESCDEDYRHCYESCGGTIRSYTKCVQFCDQERY